MDTLISYIVKSFIASVILYSYYQLVLHNKKFHSYNRFYLLISIIISLAVPFVNFKLFQIKESSNITINKILNVLSSADGIQQLFHFQISWLIFGCSVFMSTFLLILLLSKIVWIYKIKLKDKNIRMQGFYLIETDVKQAPFSFLNNLFWKRGMSATDTNGKKIFKHELTHIIQRHTYDKLFTQIVLCIFWFNPFYWLIQNELSVIHEFIADSESINKGDAESFALMLLQSHNEARYLDPSHSFFHSSIKRRLIMISTSNNAQYSYLRRVLALPILLLVIMFFSFSILKAQTDSKSNSGPVNVQKVQILNVQKVQIIKKSDSLADVRIDYKKPDGTPAVLYETAKYSNNDPLKKEMIYFVDGFEATRDNVKKLDPDKIKTINFYKNAEATKRFGEKAKNGAIVFTTK